MSGALSKPIVLRVISAAILVPIVLLAVYFGGLLFQALLTVLLIISVYEWITLSKKIKRVYIMSVLGVSYIFVSFLAAYIVRDTFGFAVSVVFLSALWASDIGAYFSGKLIGGAKMAPDISPNKTWAGFIGAVGFSVLTALLMSMFVFGLGAVQLSTYLLVIAGIIIAVSGQAGDLLVSMLKRQAHEKDTGAIIPGHGGVLDRIDSLLLAAPLFLIFLWAVL